MEVQLRPCTFLLLRMRRAFEALLNLLPISIDFLDVFVGVRIRVGRGLGMDVVVRAAR